MESTTITHAERKGGWKPKGEEQEERNPRNWRRIGVGVTTVVAVVTAGGIYLANRDPGLPDRNAPPAGQYLTVDGSPHQKNLEDMAVTLTDTELKAKVEALEHQPIATWLQPNPIKAKEQITNIMEQARAKTKIPLFVMYNMPHRDVGGESSGGATSAAEYTHWAEEVSNAIGDNPAVVVVEPDAAAHLADDKLSAADKEIRLSLLAGVFKKFQQTNLKTATYLDIGNAGWLSPGQAAKTIKDINERSNGAVTSLAFNTANYFPNAATRDYAQKVINEYGSPLYVLSDESRSGGPNPTQGDWCNVRGQKLGNPDTTFNAESQFEEAVIKTPGDSDGKCGVSDKPAGVFDPNLLKQQVGGVPVAASKQ